MGGKLGNAQSEMQEQTAAQAFFTHSSILKFIVLSAGV
jgi:hypothetical protein